MKTVKFSSETHQKFSLSSNPLSLNNLEKLWNESNKRAPFFLESIDDFLSSDNHKSWRILLNANGEPLLPFYKNTHFHKFTVGERKLGTMKLNSLRLVNPWLCSDMDPNIIKDAIEFTVVSEDVDIITLGELPTDSTFSEAIRQLNSPARLNQHLKKQSLRWLIDLPTSFDDYMAMLSSSTRQSTRRKIRKLYKNYNVEFTVIDSADCIESFLELGEQISRKTYQWQVGQRLINDEKTRTRYVRLASEQRLRCYLMSLDNQPCAFMRGTLQDNLYHYETPGFDPAYSKTSIGTVLLMAAIQDLIENTDAKIFDFGTGGDEVGYKSKFGTKSIPCNSNYILNMNSNKAKRLFLIEFMLNTLKNLVNYVLPQGKLRNWIKRSLRKYNS